MRDFTGTRCEACGGICKRIDFPKGAGLICVNQHCVNSSIERRPTRRWIGRLTLILAVLSVGISIYNEFAHKKLDNLRLSIIESQQIAIEDWRREAMQSRSQRIETNNLMFQVIGENSLLREFIKSQGWSIVDSVDIEYPDPRTFKPVDVI